MNLKGVKAMLNLFRSERKNYENLDGNTFRTRYQYAPKAELLDVRTAGEFASGSINGASNQDAISSGAEEHRQAQSVFRVLPQQFCLRQNERVGL